MPIIYLDFGADISPCGFYRYSLWRAWDYSLPICAVAGVNPSIADHRIDDPTIRRCVYFARREGCGTLIMVNEYGFRETDPEKMKRAADPIGPGNDAALLAAMQRAQVRIVAWGVNGTFRDRDKAVCALLGDLPLYYLGTTKDGHPRHPLYVRSDAPLIRYIPRS